MEHYTQSDRELATKKWISDDVKLVIATVTIVSSILISFYSLQSRVDVLSSKVDTILATIAKQQDAIIEITKNDAVRDSKLSVINNRMGINFNN